MIAFYCQMNVRINKTEMKSVSPEEAKWKNFLSLSPCVSKFFNLVVLLLEEDHQWLSGRAAPHWMQKDANLYRRTIFAEVAKGLQRYCSKLLQGAGPFDNNHQVIDALSSKCEAWRRAMRLVNMISRVDVVLTKA